MRFTGCYGTLYLGLWLLTVSTGAPGEEVGDCGGNQIEMNRCAMRLFKEADTELNKTYRKIMADLSPEKQKELRNEQRKWLQSLERECTALADREIGDGSLWGAFQLGCKEEATRSRTSDLIQYWSK